MSQGFLQPAILCNHVVDVIHVVDVMMGNLPYILFLPKAETKEYVVLLFLFINMDDAACEVQKNIEIIKQEFAVDQFQLRCLVENVPAARRQFLYLVNNYVCMKVQKDDVCHLPPDNYEQLETFVKLLTNPEPTKKRKVDILASTPWCVLLINEICTINVVINCE